jgi:hypothetical protein
MDAMAKRILMTICFEDPDRTAKLVYCTETQRVDVEGFFYPGELRLASNVVRLIREQGGYQRKPRDQTPD